MTFAPRRSGAIYLLLMMAVSLWLAAVLSTGGFAVTLWGVRLSSRSAGRPAVVLAALLVLYIWKRRDRYQSDAAAVLQVLTRRARLLALAIALGVCATTIVFGTWTAGGADSFGYVSQSALWLDGNLVQDEPLLSAPWPTADIPKTVPPLGYTRYHDGAAIVPVYAPGLPLIMALFRVFAGECGPYLVAPVFAALGVFAIFLLGEQAGSRILGLAAAVWLACSPAFLYTSMWPMTDVPVATVWTFSILFMFHPGLVSRTAAGVAAGIAILIRPNLAPVLPLLVIGLVLLERTRSGWKRAFLEAAAFAAGAFPGVAIAASVHHVLYGAPWRAGYRGLDALFSADNILPNAVSYTALLIKTQTPLILLAIVALFGIGVRGSVFESRALRLCTALFVAGIWMAYLVYAQFEEWWYLRFLLPTFPILIVLSLVPIWTALGARPAWITLPLGWIGLVGLSLYEVDTARKGHAFALQGERRYQAVGNYVRQHLPENAALLSMQHSGSARYYGRRTTVSYPSFKGAELPKALETLKALGYRPYILLEDWEEPEFRARFQGSGPVGNLDIGRVARYPQSMGVTIYDPDLPPVHGRDIIPDVVQKCNDVRRNLKR